MSEPKICPLLVLAGRVAPWDNGDASNPDDYFKTTMLCPEHVECIRERCAWWGWCQEAEEKAWRKEMHNIGT